MGIDLTTWRARIGLNYYHMGRPFQTRWRSSGGRLYQPGVASWGVGEVMSDTPLVLKGCMTVVALSLILQYVVHSWSKLKGGGGSGKVHCHWRGSTSQMKGNLNGGGTLMLRAIMVVVPLLLVIAGDVELNPGPPKREALTLKAAINALHSVCPKWYNIGVQLEVPTFQLKNIEKKTSDSMDQLRDMLDYWMSNDSSPSWRHLVDALKAPSVGENRLGEEIEKKYCCPVEQSSCDESEVVQCHQEVLLTSQGNETTPKVTLITPELPGVFILESPSTSAARCSSNISPRPSEDFEPVRKKPRLDSDTIPEGSSSSPCTSKGSQKLPFGCGCGKCTFFSFIERGCPTPIPSASSFSYLDLSGLSNEQQQELRGRLRFESQEIMIRFQELVSATIESLIGRNVSPKNLVTYVMTLGAFDPVFKEPQMPVLQHRLQELKAANTICEVFLVLNEYFSFFNYQLLQHIIKSLGTEEDKAGLQRYKENFNQYAKRRVFECLPEFGPISDADHADIFVKLDSQYDNYTVAQIEGFRHKLSEILRVSFQGILRLCRVDKGCVQLMFQVPSFVQREIFPLSREQEKALLAVGVIMLRCGKYQFQKDEPSQIEIENKHQHDPDDDSGIGPSTFTDTKSTTFSEDCLGKEMNELDYELQVQGLVKTVSAHKYSELVTREQLEDVMYLAEKMHCNPMQRDRDSFAIFHIAAIVGNVQALKYFITERSCNPACQGPLGLTPLHLASEQGHLDVVKYLVIEQQMEPLCEDEYRNTPLHRACARGYQAVVEFLTSELSKYAPIADLMSDLKNKWNSTPLDCAVAHGHLDILKFFVSDHNCDPNLPGQHGGALLHTAAEFGYLHVIEYLTDVQGCNPSCVDKHKYTPLHCAAMKGHTDIVKFLTVEKHCDPMCRDYKGNTPLHFATIKGYINIVKFLTVEGKCDPMCRNYEHNTPLHKAASNGHIAIVKFLTLELNCDQKCVNVTNDTPLHLAAMKGHLDILQYLISDQKCDRNLPGQYGRTPLHMAATFGHLHILKYLTDKQGCNPSCLDEHKRTPLHWAAVKGHMDIVKFLTAEKRSDPMSQDLFENTALHYAVVFGYLEVVQFFVEELKCPPDIEGQHNMTPLQLARGMNHSDIAQYLQKHSVIPYIYTAIAMMKQLGLLK